MSSTSTSECECDQYWPAYETRYNANYRHAYGSNPYYPTMGQPLVYYAQAPCARNLTHRGRDRERGSPNCFVKAFRWYTKEHKPIRSESPIKPDMSGFAAWLDVKYDQFLQDSQLGSEMYHVKLKQTLQAERVPTINDCEPCTTKNDSGKRWMKKRRSKSNDTGAVRQRSNQSCRYIMQPKDNMSRPPSICCHPSNATTTLSDCVKKPLGRSQSFSNATLVIKNRAPCNITQGPCSVYDTKPKGDTCQNNTCKRVDSKFSLGKVEISAQNKVTSNQAVSCNLLCDTKTKVDVCQNNTVCQRVNSKQSIGKVEVTTQNKATISQTAPCNICDTKTKVDECKRVISIQSIDKIQVSAQNKATSSQAAPCNERDSKTTAHVSKNNACSRVVSLQSIDKVEISTQNKTDINQAAPCKICNTTRGDVCQNNTCKSVRKQSIEKIEVTTQNKTNIIKDFCCQCDKSVSTKTNAGTQYDVSTPSRRRSSLLSKRSNRLVDCECSEPEKITQQPIRDYESTICQPILPCDYSPRECACKSLDTMPRKVINRMPKQSSRHSQKNIKSKIYKNIECQCPTEKIVNVDTHTQYAPHPKTCFDNNLCECDFKGSTQPFQNSVQSVSIPSHHLPLCSCQTDVKEGLVYPRFAQTTSQTSNHSIRLEKETVHAYPFFMKIVCADKLSNEKMK